MCKVGDIIVVKEYVTEDGVKMSQHSFVVIDDEPGCVSGLDYTMVTSVISSFKSEEHRMRRLRYRENKEIRFAEVEPNSDVKYNEKDGFIKADQLHYFDKETLDYFVFGRISDDLLDELIDLILELRTEGRVTPNLNNLEQR